MKHLLLVLFSIGCLFTSHAQSIYTNSHDGMIWFKLKDNVVLNKQLQFNSGQKSVQDPRTELIFLADFFAKHSSISLSKPFAHFNAPALKRTYQLDFENFADVDLLMRELSQYVQIEYAERVPLMTKTLVPNDPMYGPGNQWGLFKIQAETAWNYSIGSSQIVVAVVDDAVDITHPDLAGVLWVNTDEIPGNGIDDDGNGYVDDRNGVNVATSTPSQQGSPMPGTPVSSFDHGTHVAGIACAATNNGVGIASIGHGVRLMSIRAASSTGSLTSTLQGVLYAIENGAHVINMSYGSDQFSTTYQNAINYGYNQGIVMVAACGNDNVNTVFYPAGYNNVISVAATNGTDNKASFSNYDNGSGWVDLAAPGTSIYSTLPAGSPSLYGNKQGTSMASPMVAGLAGLMLSLNPTLTPADIENCLKTTCDPVAGAFSGQLGSGRINAANAMACVSSTLNWAPVADFSANITVIPQGSTVNFTNLSIYNPTSYAWSFTGGTPATSAQVNPQNITYNTPGTYAVSLTATNANGSDTETKTAYIQVNPTTGCDTITHTLPADTIYTYTLSTNSYLGGTNIEGVTAYNERYLASEFPPGSYIQNMIVYFVRGQANNANETVTFRIWSSVAGQPGAVLHTQTVSLQEIEDNQTVPGQPNSFYPTIVEFDNPYLINQDFFIGIEVPNPVPAGQQYAIAYTHDFNDDATGRPNYCWMRLAPGNTLGAPAGWYNFETTFIGNPRQAMHMKLLTTQYPVRATMSLTATSVCAGNSISFQNTTNNNVVTNEWYIDGVANGYIVGNTPSFIFNNPGTYMTYLVASNQCGFYAIDSTEVTVLANPVISVTPQNQYICPGGSVALTASGATTYTWSPAGSLSATTGASVTATPASTTTYTINGTQGACSSSSEVTVYVEAPPTTAIAYAPNVNLCYNQPIFFDGLVNSDDVTGFAWTFTGGSPATSINGTEYVTFPAPGTYTVALNGTNGCGDADLVSVSVTIGNCDYLGIDLLESSSIKGFYNPSNQELVFEINELPFGAYQVNILSLVGQEVMQNTVLVDQANQIIKVNVNDFAEGIYIVRFSKDEMNYMLKFKH
jgi:serine protease